MTLREMLVSASEVAVTVIDAMALVAIVFGSVVAFVSGVRVAFARSSGHERRLVWLRYSRWLVAGLTFQLAADIIESSITMNWDAIGKLGAIALIRTALNYFLERDLEDLRERDRASERPPHSRVNMSE